MAKIIGVTVGTTTPRPNWSQTNTRKSDFIKNKPDVNALIEQHNDNEGAHPHLLSDLNDLKGTVSRLDVEGKISQSIVDHNRNGASHQDIRILLEEVETKLENFLDSDDVTLDELSEIITYIKSNKSLIENITSSKVNVTDIIDNLETSLPDKVLSAKQGVELKRLIDSTNTELKDALGAYIVDLAIEVNALNATLGDGNLTEEEGA